MAEDRADARTGTYPERKWLWLELLSTFQVALDPKKLLLAAFGIVAMSLGWWVLSTVFYTTITKPVDSDYDRPTYQKRYPDASPAEIDAKIEQDKQRDTARWQLFDRLAGSNGKLSTMPWYEDRGPNPFLFGTKLLTGTSEDRREYQSWFLSNQVPVLVEPLIKFITPVVGLLNPDADFLVRVYLLLCILWMLAVWAFVGGVITRLAVVQLAGKDQVNFKDTMKFVMSRYFSYLFSPLVPLGLIALVVFGTMLFGVFHMIPGVGDIIVDGLGWPLILGAGIVMAILLVGLVGYPLMYATLSSEGSDTFDALSRSYNYVYQSPWAYLWYMFVTVIYGAVLIFFVVFMSSLMVYLGKWGVSQTILIESANREPEYLMVYTPTSFGWREVLLKGSDLEMEPIIGVSDPAALPVAANADTFKPSVPRYRYTNPAQAEAFVKSYAWYEYAGAAMVSFWVTLVFLLVLGFSYSYFWTQASLIYLLMRKKVDETEIDEVYTEDEDLDTAPVAPPRPTSPPPVTMVESPTLRVPPVAPPVVATPPVTPPVAPPVIPPPVAPPPVKPEPAKPVTPPESPPVSPPIAPPIPPSVPDAPPEPVAEAKADEPKTDEPKTDDNPSM